MTILNKTIGLVMVAFSCYNYYTKPEIEMWSFDFWFTSGFAATGIILFALGAQTLRDIINKIINKRRDKSDL